MYCAGAPPHAVSDPTPSFTAGFVCCPRGRQKRGTEPSQRSRPLLSQRSLPSSQDRNFACSRRARQRVQVQFLLDGRDDAVLAWLARRVCTTQSLQCTLHLATAAHQNSQSQVRCRIFLYCGLSTLVVPCSQIWTWRTPDEPLCGRRRGKKISIEFPSQTGAGLKPLVKPVPMPPPRLLEMDGKSLTALTFR